MNPNSLPEKPLTANMNMKDGELRAKTVYFFERKDGTVFATELSEAWNLYARNRNVKLIGTGDGQAFFKALMESREIFRTKGLEAAQQHIRNGQEAELAACRGKIIPPPNQDKIGNGAHLLG